MYFGNYKTLVYLAQTDDPDLKAKAEAAAARLGLAYEYRRTGYGELGSFLQAASDEEDTGRWHG
jgi:predicted negative regulator of RcsB-dependent stress response